MPHLSSSRFRPRWSRTVIVAVAAAAGFHLAPAASAQTAPPNDTGTPLGRLAALDATTQALDMQISAAQHDLAARRAEFATTTRTSNAAVDAARARGAEADALRKQVDGLVVAAFGGARTARLSAVLISTSPQNLLDRMTALDLLGRDTAARMDGARTARGVAEQAAANAATARDAVARSEQDALRVQQDVVARRAALQMQSDEATALLGRLTAEQARTRAAKSGSASGGSAQLVTSQQASAQRAARAAVVRNSLFAQPTVGQITSPFGARDGSQHQGVDIANVTGTPIVSVADGVIIDAGPASGFGLWVRVRHDDGTITVYGHVDTFVVKVGERVAAGQQIATIGNRGESTGPHLHLEVVPPGGQKVDPVAWLGERGITV